MNKSTKRALVTGATGKIGREVCLELARAGFDIALHYHKSEDAARTLADEISDTGRSVDVFRADLSQAAECMELSKSAGDIEVFVHCASEFERTPFGEVSAEKFDEIVAVEMRPVFLLVQSIGKNMFENGGSIICFSDVAAREPYANYIPYCMAKAGIDSMVKAFALEWKSNVRINAIAPGREADPKKAAGFVMETIESTKTGEIICIA